MSKRNFRPGARGKILATVSSLALLTVALGGCVTSQLSGSRSMYFHSIDELASYSGAIVEVEVVSVRDATETSFPSTVAEVVITALHDSPQTNSRGESEAIEFHVGEHFTARMLGTTQVPMEGVNYLSDAADYLLFVTPSGLGIENDFYIVGSGVGAYVIKEDGFHRLSEDTGDTIPNFMTAVDLELLLDR